MKTIPAGEANRHFSQVLRQAAQGETVVITSRGKAVALLTPAREQEGDQDAAQKALLARLQALTPSGKKTWTREELYEDQA